jgi:hypothetical protein
MTSPASEATVQTLGREANPEPRADPGAAKRSPDMGMANAAPARSSTGGTMASAEDECWEAARHMFGVPPHRLGSAGGGRPKTRAVREPRKLHHVRPEFPSVVPRFECLSFALEVLIGPSGDVVDVWTIRRNNRSRSCPELEEPAACAIRQWKYAPTLVEGKAVPVCTTIAVTIEVR